VPTRPTVVVFDVNETLSDMAPMAQRFADVGAPQTLARLWFSNVLRDGFALTCAGASQPFATVADGVLRVLLEDVDLDRPTDDAVTHVLAGFAELPVHPDVPPGMRRLQEAGLRLVTLSNGAASVAEALLGRAGVSDRLEAMLSVQDAGAWKPHPSSYAYAAGTCGVEPHEMLLVAVHPWDVDGAVRAGLQSAWLNRSGGAYPEHLRPPTWTATSLTDLAAQLSSS
jgi:2-haloacid dehalogenase